MGAGVDDFSERRPYNAVSDFVDANVARGLGNKIAFIDPDRSLSYGDLQARSVRFAHALRALGIRQEERVALLLHDTVDYPVAFWGAIRAGNVAVPLNTFLNVAQYAYILADSRASALIAAMPLAAAIWPLINRLPYLHTVILVGAMADDLPALPGRPEHLQVHRFDDILAQASDAPIVADSVSDEVAFWVYTSGSTGDPKGVKHVHSNLMATARLFGQGVLGIRETDVVHSAAKLFFSYGLGNAMAFPLSVGATTVLWPPRPTPDGVFAIMRKHRPTIFYAVPSLYTALLSHPDIGEGAGEDLVVPPQRRGRIAVKRRADGLRERVEADRLGVEDAVAIGEMVHRARSVEQDVERNTPFRALWHRFAVRTDGRGPGGAAAGPGGRPRGPPGVRARTASHGRGGGAPRALARVGPAVPRAGRAASETTSFASSEDSIRPYRFPAHQHTPEMERGIARATGLDVSVLFVPHLVPAVRGVVTTCYLPLAAGVRTETLTDCLIAAYDGGPFVRVLPAGGMVDAKRTRGSNVLELQAVADPRTGTAVVVGAIDNLVKGAAGQAIQNANLMLGLPEATGLPIAGVWP